MKKISSILLVCLLSLFELSAQNSLLQYQFRGVDDEFANDFAKDIIVDVIGKSQLQVNETMHYVLTYEQKTLALSYSASVSNVSGSVRQENADLYSDLEGVVRKAVEKSLEELETAVRPKAKVSTVKTEEAVSRNLSGIPQSEQEHSTVERSNASKSDGSKMGQAISFPNINFLIASEDEPEFLTWEDAKQVCSQKGPGWRLPTLDELKVMYLMRSRIKNLNGLEYKWGFNRKYWSSAEQNKHDAYYFDMEDGDIDDDDKTDDDKCVRCVRSK